MSISEQVKELRELADCYYGEIRHHVSTITNAADTIEALSAKLQAANGKLERWHKEHINEKIKNPFANTSTLICSNCDHKDEYIEELEAEVEKLKEANMERSAEDCGGWQSISEYTREKYDWVLIKYFEKGSEFECVPTVAEMHRDGTWHTIDNVELSNNYEVRYFFDMQQLDLVAYDSSGWMPLPKAYGELHEP